MLKAIGFTDEDLAKPIIGIANTWIGTMPCNYNLRELAVQVKEGIRAAGGTPMEFNTIAISDGVTMGTEGMKASLVSREVIADSIELVARGHMFDGIVALVACDKTIPGAAMALLRLNIPGVILYGGSILPGQLQRAATSPFRTCSKPWAPTPRGKYRDAELLAIENPACPGAGACGGQFTANTMATVMEMIGLSPMGTAAVPQVDPRKDDVAVRCGADGDGCGAQNLRAARHLHPPGIRERHRGGGGDRRLDQCRAALAGHGARGRRAIRHRGFRRHQRAHACWWISSPAGRFVAVDVDNAGGMARGRQTAGGRRLRRRLGA